MLTTVKGYYDKGKITLTEQPAIEEKTEVIVTFLARKVRSRLKKKRVLGVLKGKISVPNNFDEPLEDLKEYM
jgi:hypothetical protein